MGIPGLSRREMDWITRRDPVIGPFLPAPRGPAVHSVRQRAEVHCTQVAWLVQDTSGRAPLYLTGLPVVIMAMLDRSMAKCGTSF